MFSYFKNKIKALKQANLPLVQTESTESLPLSESLADNLDTLKELYHNSSDLVIKQVTVNGLDVAIITIESMVNLQLVTEMFLEPLMKYSDDNHDADALFSYMSDDITLGTNMIQIEKYEDVFLNIMSGSAVVLLNQCTKGIAFNAVGYAYRSISEPSSEVNLRGSREGFSEIIRINMTMVRRRLKSPELKFELMKCGTKSKTDICLMYMNDKVDHQFVKQIKQKIKQINLEEILDSGYIQPFLEGQPFSIFSDVGNTERPDTMCAKLSEGRVGILVDGTPFALVTPYFFTDNFQNFDDYCSRPYYVFPNRLLKYLAFFITILLPGTYVALGHFHLEMFPHALLYTIVTSQETTAFPLFYQALIITFIYEIMTEAGLRLQRPIGSAVSIIGALVIGDAAVSAGLIGSPMVMIIALTAITAFVIPSLHQQLIILRFVFIILGGTLGLYGIILGCCALLINICALENNGYIYSSPLSPLNPKALKDVILRVSWKYMNKKTDNINAERQTKDLGGEGHAKRH